MSILIFQVIVTGIVNGLIFALTATGFSLIYGSANILFFALGEIYMLGAVLTYILDVQFGLPYLLAIIFVMVGLGLFGVLLERYIFRNLVGNDLVFALVSIAIGMFITAFALEAFGEKGKAIGTPFPGKLDIFGVFLTYDKLMIVIVSVVLIMGLHAFFKLTKAGRAIRAVSKDPEVAQLMGVSVNQIKGLTFFLSLAVAAGAGGMIAPLYYVDVFMGGPVLMMTLIVVVLGGLGSFPGAIVGGLFMGFVQSFGYTFLGGVTTILGFAAVIVVLVFRPQGILGHEQN
jgi:branched-chain amino acid transport system permease protein